jgi:hypothetical protein
LRQAVDFPGLLVYNVTGYKGSEIMETINAPEYLRRERVLGEYEHERMVYNERGESVPLTQLLEDYHHQKMLEGMHHVGGFIFLR